jgi:hypothetical protein
MDLRWRNWWEGAEDCIMRNFITCIIHHILLGRSNHGWDGLSTEHARKRKERHTKLWSENLKGGDHSNDLGGMIISE